MVKSRIHKIYYDELSLSKIEDQFIALDNTKGSNEWYEFLPILRYLYNNELDENTFYGFLSPSFSEKTGVSTDLLLKIVQESGDHDAILFTPHWDQLVYFANPFDQGVIFHKGLFEYSKAFLKFTGRDIDLDNFVATSVDSCFSNYIIAKKEYWLAWKKIAIEFFNYCELSNADLGSLKTDYSGSKTTHMKVFIQERLSAIVLYENKLKCRSVMDQCISSHIFDNTEKNFSLLQECDYLKRVYRYENCDSALKKYIDVRSKVSLAI